MVSAGCTGLISRSVSSSVPSPMCLSSAAMPDFSLRLPVCFDGRGTLENLGGMGGFPDFEESSIHRDSIGRGISTEGRFVEAEGSMVSAGCAGSIADFVRSVLLCGPLREGSVRDRDCFLYFNRLIPAVGWVGGIGSSREVRSAKIENGLQR